MTGKSLGLALERDFVELLYDGEITMADAADVLRRSRKSLYRVAARLEAKGEVASRGFLNQHGRNEVRWYLTRTR